MGKLDRLILADIDLSALVMLSQAFGSDELASCIWVQIRNDVVRRVFSRGTLPVDDEDIRLAIGAALLARERQKSWPKKIESVGMNGQNDIT